MSSYAGKEVSSSGLLSSPKGAFSNIHMEMKEHFRRHGSPAMLMTFKSGIFFRRTLQAVLKHVPTWLQRKQA